MKIFSYESKFSQVVLKIAQGCYLNLLWMLFSVPLFTIGAATTGLYRVTLKMARGEEPSLTDQFVRGFKQDFKQSTLLWLVMLGSGALLGLDGYILFHLSRTTTGTRAVIWTLLLALIIAAGVVWAIILTYVFPLVASVENTSAAMLKNSFFIGTHYLFCTILVMFIHFAMFFIVVRIFTPMIIFGEGICALVSSLLLARVIAACSYDPDAAEAEEEAELPASPYASFAAEQMNAAAESEEAASGNAESADEAAQEAVKTEAAEPEDVTARNATAESADALTQNADAESEDTAAQNADAESADTAAQNADAESADEAAQVEDEAQAEVSEQKPAEDAAYGGGAEK